MPVLPQVPFAGQVVLQQMPLTQLPLVHWLAAVHEVPGPFLATQVPFDVAVQ